MVGRAVWGWRFVDCNVCLLTQWLPEMFGLTSIIQFMPNTIRYAHKYTHTISLSFSPRPLSFSYSLFVSLYCAHLRTYTNIQQTHTLAQTTSPWDNMLTVLLLKMPLLSLLFKHLTPVHFTDIWYDALLPFSDVHLPLMTLICVPFKPFKDSSLLYTNRGTFPGCWWWRWDARWWSHYTQTLLPQDNMTRYSHLFFNTKRLSTTRRLLSSCWTQCMNERKLIESSQMP